MLLCRGCCCGTRVKHPKVDHETQERRLETAADSHPGAALRVVDCLDAWNTQGGAGPLPDALSGLRFRHVPARRRTRG